MPLKTVRVECFEPLAVDRDARQTWADLWIRFKAKPGRRVVRLALTLISRIDLEQQVRRESADAQLSTDGARRAGEVAAQTRPSALLAAVLREGVALDLVTPPGLPRGYRLLTIYTAASLLHRAEAERMIRHLLEVDCGIRRCRLHWQRPKQLVIPL